MAIKVLLLFCFLLPAMLCAQNTRHTIDTLKTALKNNPTKERKARIYTDLAWHYSNISLDSALAYGNKALALSPQIGSDKLTAQIHSDLGAAYFKKGVTDAAEKHYTTSLQLREKLNDSAGIAASLNNLGVVYERRGLRDHAMNNYIKALAWFEKKNDHKQVDAIKNNMAMIYEKMRVFDKAEKLYMEVAAYRKKKMRFADLSMAYVNLGNIYKAQKKYADAEYYYKEAARTGESINDPTITSTAYFNLGFLYNEMKKPNEAIAVLEKSRALAQSVSSDYDLAKINNGLGLAYQQLGQHEKAKTYLVKALGTMEKIDRRETERLQLDLISAYSAIGMQDSARYYRERQNADRDTIMGKVGIGEAMEMEAKYQNEKKQRLLEQKEAEATQRNMVILILAAVVFFCVIIGYLIYRQQKMKNRQQQQEFELKQTIAQIETQNKLQEQRLAISKDLHDNIGSQLTFIISSVDTVNHAYAINNPAIAGRLQNISNFTQATIQELRDTVWAMNHKEISFEALGTRIMNFIEKAQAAKEDMKFSFDVNDSLAGIQLTSVEGMNIYRTIQEAVNNAIKHSGATHVSITIVPETVGIKITISDNGKGFDATNAANGNGLYNMKKRMEDIGGSFTAASSPQGTTINLHFSKQINTPAL